MQVIKPAYLALIEAHGGSRSQAWKQKTKELVAEHVKRKTSYARQISLNAAELGSQMKSLNRRWTDDVKWGARLNMHILYIMISGNPDLAASKYNTIVCSTPAMQKWCKAELPVATSLLPKIHAYIIAEQGLMGIRPTHAPKRMPSDMHSKRVACTAELIRLLEECSGIEVGSKFPWGTIPAFLIRHCLYVDNWPPPSEFPDVLGLMVGSVRTEHWTNMWSCLFATDNAKRISVKLLDIPEDQEITKITRIMRCSNGLVLLVADWEDEVAKRKPGSEDVSGPSGHAGTLREQVVEGEGTGANPKKRRKKKDVVVEKEPRKRRKVISNPIIDDEGEPQSALRHSSEPALSTSALLPPSTTSATLESMSTATSTSGVTFGMTSVVSNESFATTPGLAPALGGMLMDTTGFDFSTVDLDFSDFPDLLVSENQDLLLGPPSII